MGAISLTSSGTISLAESVTGFTGDTFELEPDIKVQGSNSVACTQSQNGQNDLYFAGSFNLTGQHIRLFWNISYVGNLAPTDPVQVFLTSGGSTDYFTYYSQNSDYAGGWSDLVVSCDSTNFPTVNLASVSQVGIRVNTASKPRNVPQNCWLDNWRYSNGIRIFSNTTETVSFADAAALDAAQVYGVLSNQDGVIFAVGEVFIGTDGSSCNFESVNETLIFPDRFVESTLYKLTAAGAGTIDIDIAGLVAKTVGANAAEVDFSSTYNTFSVTGSSFIDMGTITISPSTASPVFASNSLAGCGDTTISVAAQNCAWTDSGTVTVNAVLTSCQFNSSPATAVVTSSLDNLDGCSFTSAGTGHAVDLGTIGSSTSMTWNSTASGYAGSDGNTGNETLLVNVASGQTLTINDEGGGLTVRNTGPGAVNVIAGAVTVRVTARTTSGDPIQGARVFLKRGDDSVVLTGITDAAGVVQDTAYTYQGDEAVTGWVRKSTSVPYYKQGALAGTITSTGYDNTAILISDD